MGVGREVEKAIKKGNGRYVPAGGERSETGFIPYVEDTETGEVFKVRENRLEPTGIRYRKDLAPDPALVEEEQGRAITSDDLALPPAPDIEERPAPPLIESQITKESGPPIPKSALADIKAGTEQQATGIQAEGAAVSAGAEGEKAVLNDLANQQTKDADAFKELAAKRKQAIDAALTELQSSSKKLEEMGEIDQNRLFKRMDNWQKVLAGAAILIGGIGKGLAHSKENAGWAVINGAIQRDIDAQKDAFNRAKSAFEKQQTLFGQLIQKYGDEEQVMSILRGLYLQPVETKLKSLSAETKSATVKANVQRALGELKVKSGQAAADLAAKTGAKTQVTTKIKPGGGEGQLTTNEIRQSISDKDTAIGQANLAAQSLMEFQSAKKVGSGAALSQYIAKGLAQGSYSPSLADQISAYTVKEKAQNLLDRFTSGSPEAVAIVQKIEAATQSLYDSKYEAAKPQIDQYDQWLKQRGVKMGVRAMGFAVPGSVLRRDLSKEDRKVE